MPRRTHYARLQRVEWRSGTCLCQQPRVLICAKDREAHQRGELVMEPCPAGCAPERRDVIVLDLSPWRAGAECACPRCDPLRQRRPAVAKPVAARPLPAPELAGAPAAGADASEPQPEPPQSPAPGYGVGAGPGQPLPAVACDAAIDDGPPRVVYPLGGVGVPTPCAACGHEACRHQAPRLDAICRCGWGFQNHDATSSGLSRLYPNRFSPCLSYRAEPDGCDECGCAGYRLPYERVAHAARPFGPPSATVATPVVRREPGLRTRSGGPIYVPGASDSWLK